MTKLTYPVLYLPLDDTVCHSETSDDEEQKLSDEVEVEGLTLSFLSSPFVSTSFFFFLLNWSKLHFGSEAIFSSKLNKLKKKQLNIYKCLEVVLQKI